MQGIFYVLQETWSKILVVDWAETHTGVQRNKFQKPEKMELPAPETAEAAGMFLKFKNSSKIIQAANKFQKLPGTSQEPEEDTEKKKSSDSI